MTKDTKVSLQIPEDLHEKAKEVARANGMSFSAFVRFCLFRGINLSETTGLPVDIEWPKDNTQVYAAQPS